MARAILNERAYAVADREDQVPARGMASLDMIRHKRATAGDAYSEDGRGRKKKREPTP